MTDIQKKWELRYRNTEIEATSPAKVLADGSHLLPSSGKALDLACGAGKNAIFLAKQGLNVDAFDNASVIIRKLSQYAKQHDLKLNAQVFDIEKNILPPNTYDVIIVSYFLERDIFPSLLNALRADGLLFYQTWSQEKVSTQGPSSTRFRLAKGELLQLCNGLDLLLYREEGNTGKIDKGFRDEVIYIGKKSC